MIDVCLCTFNPRPDVLKLVLESIAAQTLHQAAFSVLVVDNASFPPVDDSALAPLKKRRIASRLVRENRPGIFHARNRAMRESTASLILWIDDDTELPREYIARCLQISFDHPDIGCFGGKLLLGPHCRFPRWTKPIHSWLAVIDRGDAPITNKVDRWGPWEPPTAGAVVRRTVITRYLEFVANLPAGYSIGQVGNKDLMRGEDSLLMRMAVRVGLACSYQPSLQLIHHIDNRRFRTRYLFRLFYGYGRSYVRLEKIMGESLPPMTLKNAWSFFRYTRRRNESANWGIYLLMKAWNLGYIAERTIRKTNDSSR